MQCYPSRPVQAAAHAIMSPCKSTQSADYHPPQEAPFSSETRFTHPKGSTELLALLLALIVPCLLRQKKPARSELMESCWHSCPLQCPHWLVPLHLGWQTARQRSLNQLDPGLLQKGNPGAGPHGSQPRGSGLRAKKAVLTSIGPSRQGRGLPALRCWGAWSTRALMRYARSAETSWQHMKPPNFLFAKSCETSSLATTRLGTSFDSCCIVEDHQPEDDSK